MNEWDQLQKIGIGYLNNYGGCFESMYPHSAYTFKLAIDRDVMIAEVVDSNGESTEICAVSSERGLASAFSAIAEKLRDMF